MKKIGLFWLFLGLAQVFAQEDARALYGKVQTTFESKQYAKCVEICKKMEQEMPEIYFTFEAKEYLGKSFLEMGQIEEGITLLFQILDTSFSFHYEQKWAKLIEIDKLSEKQIQHLKTQKEGIKKRLIGMFLCNYLYQQEKYDDSFHALNLALKYPYAGCRQECEIMAENIKAKRVLLYGKTTHSDSILAELLPYLLNNPDTKQDYSQYSRRLEINEIFETTKQLHSKAEMMQAWETFFAHLEIDYPENSDGYPTPYYKSQMFGIEVHLPYEYGGEAYKETLIQVLKKSYFYILCEKG